MKTIRFIKYLGITVITVFILTACSPAASTPAASEVPGSDVIGIPNPAAVYCEGRGYDTESVERNGGMDADCVFPDGSRCAQWDFLAGRCGQQFTFCESQGGTMASSDANIGNCIFEDGSSCGEYDYYAGLCSLGVKPAEVIETTDPVASDGEIQGFSQALEYLVAYFNDQYGLGLTGSWTEQNITDPGSGGITSFRYVNGPFTIALSAQASAPWPTEYIVKEASSLSTGFYWEGTLSYTGVIKETRVILPAVILNETQARDAVLAYLASSHNIAITGDWMDEGLSQGAGTASMRTFTLGSWTVVVQFEPVAPMVPNYTVAVESSTGATNWQGEITSQGVITETAFSN